MSGPSGQEGSWGSWQSREAICALLLLLLLPLLLLLGDCSLLLRIRNDGSPAVMKRRQQLSLSVSYLRLASQCQ